MKINHILAIAQEHPSTDHSIKELPNIISFVARKFHDTFLGTFLHFWDTIIFSVFIAVIISIIFYVGASKKELIPTGLQNFLEFLADSLRSLVHSILGHEGDKYVPFLGTLFVYILAMNLFGLIPLMKSPSSSLSITIAQAICVFILVQFLNIRNMGIGGFLYHLAGSPKTLTSWLMVPLLFPIELLTQISRPVTLAFRLFGNIFGEDVLIRYFVLLGIAILPFIHPFSVPLQLPFVFFAVLTSVIQALVFTLLTAIYILLSTPHADEPLD